MDNLNILDIGDMNRVIKFRVWRVKENRFNYNGGYVEGYLNEELSKYVPSFEIYQQFTGILDKNGKEIYEGDIVKYNPDKPVNRMGVIEFSDYYHGWVIKDSKCYPESEFGIYSVASPFLSFNDVEVIGNMFENPELCN